MVGLRIEQWAVRLYALVLALGGGGLLAAAFALATGIGRVSIDRQDAHALTFLGLSVSYPYANAPALALVTLAGVGAAVLIAAIAAAARHLAAARRVGRRLRDTESCGEVMVLDDPSPAAFCAGLLRPRIYVSRGALRTLDVEATRAVIAHERHHRDHRDPLRVLLATILGEALFFLPGMARLRGRFVAMLDLAADEAAIRASGPRALAAAMLAFDGAATPAGGVGIAPERVDHLAGRAPSSRLPLVPLVLGAVLVATMLVGAWATGQHAVVRTTLAVPGLSHQPCVLVLASLPGGLAAIAALTLRSWHRT